MGRERKRGALESLNRALLDGVFPDELAAASDAPETLRGRFATVITLDADTSLPPGSALELAGMLQHPLNRPMTAQGRRARLRGHSAAHGGVRRNRAHAHCQPVGRGRGL